LHLSMKNAVFWGVMPCGSCNNRRFGRTYNIPEYDILHSHRRENHKFSRLPIAIWCWTLTWWAAIDTFSWMRLSKTVTGATRVWYVLISLRS
jgi:hypothetical protein